MVIQLCGETIKVISCVEKLNSYLAVWRNYNCCSYLKLAVWRNYKIYLVVWRNYNSYLVVWRNYNSQ